MLPKLHVSIFLDWLLDSSVNISESVKNVRNRVIKHELSLPTNNKRLTNSEKPCITLVPKVKIVHVKLFNIKGTSTNLRHSLKKEQQHNSAVIFLSINYLIQTDEVYYKA